MILFQHEWFFDHNEYERIPAEINPQMPKLPPILTIGNTDSEFSLNTETKPSEIIQQIVRAAKRRWSSPLLLDSLSSLSTTDQQTSKPINISVKRYLFLHLTFNFHINFQIFPVLFVRIKISFFSIVSWI
jgi:hypothetical protein